MATQTKWARIGGLTEGLLIPCSFDANGASPPTGTQLRGPIESVELLTDTDAFFRIRLTEAVEFREPIRVALAWVESLEGTRYLAYGRKSMNPGGTDPREANREFDLAVYDEVGAAFDNTLTDVTVNLLLVVENGSFFS